MSTDTIKYLVIAYYLVLFIVWMVNKVVKSVKKSEYRKRNDKSQLYMAPLRFE